MSSSAVRKVIPFTAIPLPAVVEAVTRKLTSPGPLIPGEYPCRGVLSVSLDCVVSRGKDTEARPAYRPDVVQAMAALAEAAGIPLGQLPSLVELALGSVPSKLYLQCAQLGYDSAKDSFSRSTVPLPRAGSTNVKGVVEVQEFVAR